MTNPVLLNSTQMARFASRGFLRLDAVVPEAINQQFLHDIRYEDDPDIGTPSKSKIRTPSKSNKIRTPSKSKIEKIGTPRIHYQKVMQSSVIPVVKAGTPLDEAYPSGSALKKLVDLPIVRGAIQSLVGSNPHLDHHFLHMTFPPRFYTESKTPQASQNTHQDSTIDPRKAFDLQIMYFPHRVTKEMGGTRFIPGTHLRVVSEAAIGRYQNILGQQHVVCEAGTLLLLHMGIWHGGGLNRSDDIRYMFKIRLCPRERQVRLWDDTDLPKDHFEQRPLFWTDEIPDPDHLHTILTTPEPWFEADTGRLEYLNRIRFWRYLLGDESFDADYWLTRVENEYDAAI